MLTTEVLRLSIRAAADALVRLDKQLAGREDLEVLPLAVALVETERIKGTIGKLAKKLRAADGGK